MGELSHEARRVLCGGDDRPLDFESAEMGGEDGLERGEIPGRNVIRGYPLREPSGEERFEMVAAAD